MMHRLPTVTALVVAMGVVIPSASAANKASRVSSALRHDTSRPLREIPVRAPRPMPSREIKIGKPIDLAQRYKGGPVFEDSVRQADFGQAASPAPSVNFDGQSDDDNAAVVGGRVVPPDTNGDIGKNHYVQTINLVLAVYNKTTGARVLGPVPTNTLWTGFGGICETNNDGDPVVLYDHLADRWVVSQFAIGSDGHQCVAVSTTGDPTGSYYRYDFTVSPAANGFNDYPKMGVWPDGYYLSANEFQGSFQGAIAVAFERERMLQGLSAKMVKFGPMSSFFSLQPSDLDGTAPAAGTPNTFVMAWDDESWGTGTQSDGYKLWNFAVNWANPTSSTFTALPQVNAPEFDANLCNFNACVPQPRPGERLDTLSQFTMYRAQYRTFGSYDTLVVTHNVDVSGHNLAGVRWTELRRSGGGWTLNQTGTYAPSDGNHRWMGSAAMDAAGNIALGFSVSGRKTFPSVRYVTRTAADAAGTMPGGEVELVAGAGVQSSSYNRWGDYSTMSVDPVDNCTFWYTQEYYANSGSFDFKTRIGSFKMPVCP